MMWIKFGFYYLKVILASSIGQIFKPYHLKMVSAVPEQQQQQYSLFSFILVCNSNEINFDFSLSMVRFH